MSILKLKKGFTLIELMVVIVIIGILAAIAIPKLFGMSAKAKAQEVGPAMGTWAKMQQAYRMETGSWGSPKQISYKLPGDTTTKDSSQTSNFRYKAEKTPDDDDSTATKAELRATSKFSSDDCDQKKDVLWKGEFTENGGDTPQMTNGCPALTPNFEAIGTKAAPPPTGGT